MHSSRAARHARTLHRFLIEHYAGNFPHWLAPEQVRVLTLNDDEKLVDCAKAIHRELRAKIAEAEKAKVHTMLVIGGRDMDAGR
jgi:threonyl-tRNA synthetase